MTHELDMPSIDRIRWTQERKDRAIELWKKGLSGSAIAARLGGVTRSAVMGLLNRNHLLHRDLPPKPKAPKKPKVEKIAAVKKARPLSAEALALKARVASVKEALQLSEVHFDRGIPLLDLKDRQCRWCVSESRPHLFCGAPRSGSGPYCQDHAYLSQSPYSRKASSLLPCSA